MIGTGSLIYELRKTIQEMTADLSELSSKSSNIPELINSTNLLRTNDLLLEINSKNIDLLSMYKQYSEELETILQAVFEIQKDLKDILKAQSTLISEQKTPKNKKIKKKSKK